MNYYFIAAGILVLAIGLIHSVLGEWLVFKRMRESGVIPTNGGQLLLERNVRILWATWHLASVMGWGMGAILFWMAFPSSAQAGQTFIATAIAVSVFAGSMLVLVGTKGKHPGWAGLLVTAILVVTGLYA